MSRQHGTVWVRVCGPEFRVREEGSCDLGAAGVKVGDVWDPSGRDTFAEDGWIALLMWLRRPKIRKGRGIKYDTARSYISGMCSVIALSTGTRPGISKMTRLAMAKKSWRKIAKPQRRKEGVTIEQIMAMLHKARNGNKRDKECAAIAIFAFFAIARLSEVFDHGGVRWSRVTILENGDAVIRLPQSKTDVWREGTDLVIPAKWWTTITALLGDSDEDKIFPRISRVAFLKWCQKFFTDKQAGHSFRRGGATHLWKLGVPLEVIKRKGRWVTDCVFLYVNTLVRDAESVASLV